VALTLPFGLGQAPPSVRVPLLEGNFGALDAQALRERMLRLTVQLRVVPGVNQVELALPAGEGSPNVAPGDPVSLALGYRDSGTSEVFAGSVHAVHTSLTGEVRVTATDGGGTLAGLRLERSYESVSAGDVVRDLLSEAGVAEGTVEAGPSLPFYVVGRNRSALAWVDALARSSAFLAFLDGDGAFHFGPPVAGAASAGFVFAQDLLDLSVADARPGVAAAAVVGEGAAGSEGQEAWAWLLKDPAPARGESGTGSPLRLRSDPALRTRDGSDGAARGWLEASNRKARRGEMRVPGTPAALPGATVDVSGTPGGSLDGTLLVLGALHRMDARGWTTTLAVTRSAGGPGLGLPGGFL